MTDKEIDAALRTVSITIPHDEYRILQCRAVEKAVLQKLAAGVSVEPVGYATPGFGDSVIRAVHSEGTTPLYTATQLAAARVQENERCAKYFETAHPAYWDTVPAAIRALIKT